MRKQNHKMGLVKGWLLLTILLGLFTSGKAQNRPVTSTVQLMPPYSVYLADYARPGSEQMQVYLLLRDLSEPAYDVRLRLTIEGSGIRLQTNPAYQPPPITLEGGSPTIVSGETLAPYLDSRNLLFSGVTQAEYERRRALPEGFYQITVEVLDYRRADRALSRPATFMAWFTLNEPPRITAPLCGTTLPLQEPTNILFQWMDGGNVNPGSPFATEYELTLVEVFPAERNVEDAIRSSVPLLQTITTETSYLYGLTDAALIPGQKYAFRVRALDTEGVSTQGRAIFKNEGYSETCHFTYGDGLVLTPPDGIRVYAENARKALVNWHLSVDPNRYRVEYRRKAEEAEEALSWFSQETTDEQVVLRDLEPQTTYEVRVASLFQGFVSRYSAVQTFTTPEVIVAACGAAPPPSVTASTVPLITALAGQYWQVGDFSMQVRDVRGGDGTFSGWGVMAVPYLSMQIPVKFDQVWVDEDYNLVRGEVIALSESLEAFKERWQQVNTPTEERAEEDEPLADGEEGTENNNDPPNAPNTEAAVTKVAVAAEVAGVYVNEQGQVVAVDSQGNEEVIAEEVPQEGEALALQDSEGTTFTVDSDGNVSSSSGNNIGSASQSSTLDNPLLLAVLDELEERVNAWLRVHGKGPLSARELQTLADLPTGLPADAELLGYVSDYTFDRARQEQTAFLEAIEQRDSRVGAFFYQDESLLSDVQQAEVQEAVALQLTQWGLIGDFENFLNGLGLQGACLGEGQKTGKTSFWQYLGEDYSTANVAKAVVLAFNAGTVKVLYCLSSRDNCRGGDYWEQFSCGAFQSLVEEIDLNGIVEAGLAVAKTYLKNRITCLQQGSRVMTAFNGENTSEILRNFNRCYFGIDLTSEEMAGLYNSARDYVLAHYQDPYDHGKATMFVLTLVSPTKIGKAAKLRALARLEKLGHKVDELTVLRQAVDAEDTKKVLDELADASKKGRVLSDVDKALAVDGMPSASGQFRQFSLSINDDIKNLRAGNFAKKIDNKFNHYLSRDGQYYVKHCPNTGELLLVDVKKKEYLGYAIDQVDNISGLKLIQNSTPEEFEKSISIWKRLRGLDEATEIYVKGRKISLPNDKITVILGKYFIEDNPFEYLTTKDIFDELGLNNLKYWELSRNLTPSSQRIHMLNLPKGAYTPSNKNWWTTYNAQLINDIIAHPDKYNVVILTDVVKPNGIEEVNNVLRGVYSDEINALSEHFDFKTQYEFWTIKIKD